MWRWFRFVQAQRAETLPFERIPRKKIPPNEGEIKSKQKNRCINTSLCFKTRSKLALLNYCYSTNSAKHHLMRSRWPPRGRPPSPTPRNTTRNPTAGGTPAPSPEIWIWVRAAAWTCEKRHGKGFIFQKPNDIVGVWFKLRTSKINNTK